jgi:hypothetical protein
MFLLMSFYEIKTKDIYIEKPSYIINCKNKNFDYVVGGSSRVHNNFNTPLFDSLCQINGFNIGYGGSALSQNYLTLYMFLKNGNKIRNYLQQVEDDFLMDPKKAFTYPFQDYFFMPYIGDENVDNCYKRNVSLTKFYLWKYIPFVKYAEFNNYYSLKKIAAPIKIDSSIFKFKGYNKLEIDHVKEFPAKFYKKADKKNFVDESNIFYLNKIRDLCAHNGINFIIYSSPLYKKKYIANNQIELHTALINYVTKNKIKYFNFMLDKRYEYDSLFYDETHLNSIGTDLFTAQLSDSLKNILKK